MSIKNHFLVIKLPIFLAFLAISILLIGLFSSQRASALSWYYPYYDVEIDINQDSSFIVKEKSEFVFSGELNGMRRDITLFDKVRDQSCANEDSTFLCGGFEFLRIDKVLYKGKELTRDQYKLYNVTDEYSEQKYFRIEYQLYPEPTYVTNEIHSWEIHYTVFGGIQWLDNFERQSIPIFYWNLLPETRGGEVEESTIRVNLPEGVIFNSDKAELYSSLVTNFEYENNSLLIKTKSLPNYGHLTLKYEFSRSDIIKPASLNYKMISPKFGIELLFNGGLLPSDFGSSFEFLPIGAHEFRFERSGYEPQEFEIEAQSGEIYDFEVSLVPEPYMSRLLWIERVLFFIGILLVPLSVLHVYRKYKAKGIDRGKINTVIPKFKPYKNIKPYMMGSVVDEKVDKTDITGTIIDLAYRGFVHIKEIKSKKNYELTKLDGKEGEELDEIEQKLMDIIFGDDKKVQTKDLTSSTILKLYSLKNNIGLKMVQDGYFERSPESVRNQYYMIGSISLILGVILTLVMTVGITSILGISSFSTIGIALGVMGISFLMVSKYMPAKTVEGSKLHNEILGFKMYLNTAERYRLKDLKPEEFEKYLSYAVVLGVEKGWAKSFKGIYNAEPDWYEGRNGGLVDAWILSNALSSFNAGTTSQFNSTVSAANSASGGGWSGGGGGFSGGGGGGGSSGGW